MTGRLYVIESGTDGSGKHTQTQKLYTRLEQEGYRVKKVQYPNYQSSSSALVKMYLRGKFGSQPDDVNPYAASSFFAVDRFASYVLEWKQFYEDGGIVIADRYTTSNMVHQASKINDIGQRKNFLDWLWDFEFSKFGLPVPDRVLFLDVPPAVTAGILENRKNRLKNCARTDIHEDNGEHLQKSYDNACWVAREYGWTRIDCVADGNLKSIDQIHEVIYGSVCADLSNL